MTIKDIAAYCNVSVSTVSRVLNDHPDVSASVRRQVLDAVEAFHYVPNASARDLVRTPADTIGLIAKGIGNPFYTEIIWAIEEEIRRAGYTLVMSQIKTEDDELKAGAELVRSKRLKGLIFLGGRFDYGREVREILGVPFVCCTFTNRFGTLEEDTFSSVSIDDEAAAFEAVSHLIENGHKEIAILLDDKSDHSISELRYRGYEAALRKAGLSPDPNLVIEVGDYEMASAYRGVSGLIRSGRAFTAIFATSDAQALAAMKALVDAGKVLPDDCSVIAIDGIDFSEYATPTLTTLVQPRNELGSEAASLLIRMIEGRGCEQKVLPTTLRKGGSVRRL